MSDKRNKISELKGEISKLEKELKAEGESRIIELPYRVNGANTYPLELNSENYSVLTEKFTLDRDDKDLYYQIKRLGEEQLCGMENLIEALEDSKYDLEDTLDSL